ncbi:KGK domain-containing protein [Oscillatoria acuminata]|uniref:KGK domain protein n=1 Tax=Oscillatoria acuminata PCC 6304 TaxID=56110 RepID=K9TL41_9CYAN|nr:KGK domain-containing protein [Oscillatoria acuminata]AFY83582.1 KGK domain protein [Oscillatoria acuminata PCC 6304]
MDETWIMLNSEEDIISQQFNSGNQLEDWAMNFTGLEILNYLREQMSGDEEAFIDGFECRVLQPGKKWQTGKIRIKINVEFCPDDPSEPDSPLDDIRKMDR